MTKLLIAGKVQYVLWPRPRTLNRLESKHDRVIAIDDFEISK